MPKLQHRLQMVASIAMAAMLAPTVAMAQSLNGSWIRGDGAARVRIAPCGGSICAVNTWIKDVSGGEAVGDRLVMDVAPSGPNALKGQAFDAKRNLRYAIDIQVASNAMSTRGCVLGGVICKSVSWRRVN